MKPANTNEVSASGTLADVPKDKVLQIRVTADERVLWQAAADADQRSLSDWLRVVANAAAVNAKPKRKKARS